MISTGGHLTILESVDSTNNYAMARVRTGLAKHGDAYFAMAQLSGKGQRGKTWETERGTNIIITLVLRPGGLQLQNQFHFNAAIALAAYDFFSSYAGTETSIKWPNDIYWRDRKAGGILIENIIGPQESGSKNPVLPDAQKTNAGNTQNLPTTSWQWAITGLGININQTEFPGIIRNPVSLKQITGKDYNVIEMAKDLCIHVQNRFTQLSGAADLLQEYNSHLFKKGQMLMFKKDTRVFTGMVKEVNSFGQLVLTTAMDETFDFGTLEWLPDQIQ